MKRKVCVVVTARPSYSRIMTALKAIEQHPDLELQLVVAASALLDRYGNAVKIIEQDGFKITARVFMIVEGENLVTSAKSTGLGLVELATVFDNLKPDVVVTIADRYETLATAVAASYMNIPVAHVQGGEVTGSIDEKVRHAVTKLSNIHFAATEKAAERIIKMGEAPDTVFVTGCPSIDIAHHILKDPAVNFNPIQKYLGVGYPVEASNGYLVVLQHPVTTEYEEARNQINETLYAIDQLGLPTYWFWPNVDAGSDGTSKGIRMFREKMPNNKIRFFKSMEPSDFLRLIYNSYCVVGNSSVAIRECSYMGVPAVNIGNRQISRERGKNVIDAQYNRQKIMEAINQQLNGSKPEPEMLYGNGSAGKEIANLLATISLQIEKVLHY